MKYNENMNSSSSEAGPQFDLPTQPEGLEKQRERSMEVRPDQESGQSKKAPKATSDNAITQIPVPGAINIPVQDVQTTKSAAPTTDDTGMPAHDVDLIEKQWVQRAKAIVAQTQDDPHAQKKEMGKVKAEYIKKRFNKTIPTDDTVAA